jgi:hypothetical protein
MKPNTADYFEVKGWAEAIMLEAVLTVTLALIVRCQLLSTSALLPAPFGLNHDRYPSTVSR